MNEQVAVLPAASVTRKLFVVFPIGKVAPLARPVSCTTACPGQLSEEVTEYVTTAPQTLASLFTVVFAGQTIVGAWLSFTVTLKEQVAVLPDASMTRKLLVVVPAGKVAPLARPVS